MPKLSSRDRLLRTLAGQPVDRVPIRAPVGWSPFSGAPPAGHFSALPNYQRLLPLVREYGDQLVHLGIPEQQASLTSGAATASLKASGHRAGIFDRRFLFTPPELRETSEEPSAEGGSVVLHTLHTPRGDLTCADALLPDTDAAWQLEYLVKDITDVEKLLAMPYRFDPPDLSGFYENRTRLGDQGLAAVFVSAPLVCVSNLMGVQTFLEWTVTERALIDRLMAVACERVSDRLQYVLSHDVGPIIHFGGSEQATPPLMGKMGFDHFVGMYERPLWDMARAAGRIVWIHCHGKIATVLDRFLDAGVHMMDPVEPPPQGDIEMGEAKRRAAATGMTLIGNVEVSDLQNCTPDEIEDKVRRAIEDGGRERTILGASEGVLSQVDDRLRDNIIRFMEAGVKYGAC